MADLKIPNINKKFEKKIFKKKFSLRTKSKRKLINESLLMISIIILIFYINYLIPNKKLIFSNLTNNVNSFLVNTLDALSFLYEIILLLFIILSLIIALFLIIGVFSRILRLAKGKSNNITYK